MKYVIPVSTLKTIEEENFDLLYGVLFYGYCIRRPSINSFNGWVIEADNSFDLYCAIKHNRQNIIPLHENEINQLILYNAVFFDKERNRLISEKFYKKYDK